ncbi:MAG: molybdate ABC transporter permease subunit [Spirochaetaceae bacterium]|jgi:molybdate transport system permease protein|nr:molybdate ABC transporter permease subunit [Spirochaetaceae bacterium]
MLNNQEILQTVLLSIKIGLLATLVNLPLAILAVQGLLRRDYLGKSLVEGVINLPLVLPPVTTGYLLLLLLGKKGFIGGWLFERWGISIAFSTMAAVIAGMVVSFPLMVRSIRVAIEMIDPALEKAALTLGASKVSVFLRITMPLALPGILSGVIVGFARCLGEFGATMTFAGNLQGESRTIALSVYSQLQIPGRESQAALLVIISIVISFGAMITSSLLNKALQKRSPKNGENTI